MRHILLSLVLVTGFLAGWVVPHPVSSLAEEDQGKIVFTSDRDGDDEIYLMNADGSDPVQLTFNDTQDRAAVWSPDGSRITFVSKRDGNQEIYVMNSDGSAPQQVTNNQWDDWVPTWSPDGQWLAWAGESRRAEIYLLHLESDAIYQITSNSAQEWRPIWRPVISEAPAAQPAVLLVFGQQFIPGIYETEVPILEEAGYRVVVASNTSNTLRAKESDLRVDPDLRLQDVRVEDYAAILFNCDNDLTLGTAMPETNRIVQDAVAQGIVQGAICSGPRVLAYAGVVDGLITTGEPSRTCQMLEEQGATCTGAAVEQDGLIVTARDRYAARQFTTAVLELLTEQETE